MALNRVQVVLPMFTNLPRDVIVNQFHFLSDVPGSQTTANLVAAKLLDFYETVYGTAGSGHAAYINWPGAHVRLFALNEPTPRVPYVASMAMAAGSGATTLPTEVAAVASFHAAPESGVAFQRLYNRVFLGALNSAIMDGAAAANFPRFNAGFIGLVNTAMEDLLAANTVGSEWVQVSNAGGVTEVRPIVGGWCDNSPDTQRRRSVGASVRTVWP